MFAKLFLEDFEYASGKSLFAFAALEGNFAAAGADLHIRASAEESEAANLLAALDRFEQAGIRLFGCDCQKRGDWCEQVGCDGLGYRYKRSFTREAGEFFVVGSKHIWDAQAFLFTCSVTYLCYNKSWHYNGGADAPGKTCGNLQGN